MESERHRRIWFAEWDRGAEELFSALTDPATKEILIGFDCMGGNAHASLGLAAMLESTQVKTRGLIVGICWSAAVNIWAACQERYVIGEASAMFHQTGRGLEGRLVMAELLAARELILQTEEQTISYLTRRFNEPRSFFEEKCRSGPHRGDAEHFVSADEMIRRGWAERWRGKWPPQE